MLVDDVTIKARAGNGGDGAVLFARAKFDQGPTGGTGGQGGNVILKGVADLGALKVFRTRKDVFAADGENGGQNTRTGANGKDVIVLVPVGTVAHDLTNKREYEITSINQEIVVARGGNGGFGNHHFRSSRNTSPDKANPGEEGEVVDLRMELKMIADVGFVGFPNVGKSSLLNELTNASSRVANYKFTTLEPHLGVFFDLILADIPGIIEGASEGRGLGHKFLKHIERTKVLFHFVAADSENPISDYDEIRKELGKFNKKLLDKKEYVIISRSDEVDEDRLKEIADELKKRNSNVTTLSLLDEKSVENVKKILSKIQEEK
ncbi:MAG: GTPase ObgE [Candidatus Moranbacteria bacterium]|nr:GTPase ObgE [Candidatus Moranbacteria bacterium]